MAANSSVYVGNLCEKVTEELLYELFLQAGPVASVNIPTSGGRPKPFGFVQFKHQSSVPYAIDLLDGITMFGKALRLNLPKNAFTPGMPPMGVPIVNRLDLQPAIHPSLQNRLGPRRRPDDDPKGPRHRDLLSRPSQKTVEDSPEFDIDAIPDILDSFGPPVPPPGPPRSHGLSNRRNDRPYDRSGSHRRHQDSRRERHSHHSNNRKRF